MSKRYITKVLLSLALISGLTTGNYKVLAEDNKFEVSTVDTKLQSHNQVYKQGNEKQLAKVNRQTMRFIKELIIPAYESGKEYGLYPSVTLAQAVLESGSGLSTLSIAPYNNLFGVKGFYQGNSVQMRTFEDDGTGHQFEIYANFKAYPDWDSSIRDHDMLLRNGLNGFYSGAWRSNAKSPEEATKHLEGRYATDTNYASKLNSIIETYNLKRFDGIIDERDIAWIESDSLDPWERPIVEVEVDKVETWASVFVDAPENLAKRVKSFIPLRRDSGNESADVVYVSGTLGVDKNFTERDIPRYKRNPIIGDIAVYTTENGDNEVVQKFAVVESVEDDTLLISEGVKGERGIHSIYRVIHKDSFYKFEFISREGL